MYEILRCVRCNKPFNKQSTLKRHGYYCRSREPTTISRLKSCVTCAKRKVRCDNKRPGCSRCVVKGMDCEYPSPAKSSLVEQDGQGAEASPTSQQSNPAVWNGTTPARRHEHAEYIDDLYFPNELHNIGSEEELMPWDDLGYDIDQYLSLPTPEGDKTLHLTSSPTLDGPNILNETSIERQQYFSNVHTSVPTTIEYVPRSLIVRPRRAAANSIANLMFHNLSSYPMVLQQNAFPPYIHPQLRSIASVQGDLEALDNCVNLVHMLSSGRRGSRKLFWKNVRMECDRMCEENLGFSKWELLHAAQALSIYIIIRLDEGERDYNNLDHLLVAAVTVIAQRLATCDVDSNRHSAIVEAPDTMSLWLDWIFEESRRRVCVIYKLISLLVHFAPATLCDIQPDIVVAPLPARKELWEASNHSTWQAQTRMLPETNSAFGLAATGDLVRIENGRMCRSDSISTERLYTTEQVERRSEEWKNWCSGMDGMGGLVMLAASLVS